MSGPRLRLAIEPGMNGLGIAAARDALYAWLLARSSAGAIVLRSDVANPETVDKERRFIDDLLWLGLGWDEGLEAQGEHGPYRRSQRIDIYRSAAEKLLSRGLAYRCSCRSARWRDADASPTPCACRETPARPRGTQPCLEDLRILFRVDSARGHEDFVLLRCGGLPENDFATAVDDASMAITHVVRRAGGSLQVTRQALICDAIGGTAGPRAIELPPVDASESSSCGPHQMTTIEDCRRRGYPPEAVLNLLGHLGGSTDFSQELLTREEMLAGFDAGAPRGGRRSFSLERMDELSRRHMARMSPQRLSALAADHLAGAGLLGRPPSAAEVDWAGGVARLFVDRLSRMSDLPDLANPLFCFDPRHSLSDAVVRRTLCEPPSRRVIESVRRAWIERAEGREPTAARFQTLVTEVRRSTGAKGRMLYDPFRIALTGHSDGPDLLQAVALIERGSKLPLPRRVAGCLERVNLLMSAVEGGAG